MPERRANGSMRGTSRGDFTKPPNRVDDVIAPKSNLSFNDSRSVNLLPFGRNVPEKGTVFPDRRSRESQSAPKTFKPNNYNQVFSLASPEDFLAQSSAGKNAIRGDIKENVALHGSFDHARKQQRITNHEPGTEGRDTPVDAAPPVTSTNVQQPSQRPVTGSLIETSDDITHSAPVQVGNEVGGNELMVGPGTISIKTTDQGLGIAKIVQIEVSGEILLNEPLVESFEFKLDSCTISFYSGCKGNQTKWILTASLPEIAAGVAEALERLKPRPIYIGLVEATAQGHAGNIATVEERESLISFSDQDPTPPEAVSQFTEDLFSLMGNQFIEDAVSAINVKIGQNSMTTVASEIPSTREIENTEKQQNTLRALATSRFANDVEVGDFLNRSGVFQKLPDSTAAFIKGQVSNRFLEEAQKDAHGQEVFKTVKQQSRKQYSVEGLMSLRNRPSSAKTPCELDPCVKSPPKDEPRPLFSFSDLESVTSNSPSLIISETALQSNSLTSRLDVPIVSGRETPRKLQGLANSMYASPQTAAVVQESTNSKEFEPSGTKSFQGLPVSSVACSPLAQPSRKLSTLMNSGPSSSEALQAFSTAHHPKPLLIKPFQGLASSKYASPPTAKHGTAKTNLSTAVRSSPKNTAFVARSSTPKARVPGAKHEKVTQTGMAAQDEALRRSGNFLIVNSPDIKEKNSDAVDPKLLNGIGETGAPPSPIRGTWNTLRCDSFSSHASKDSNETVKSLMPKPTTMSVQDHTVPLRSSRAASGHQSVLGMDPSASPESFAAAIEEMNTTGQAVSENIQELVDGAQSVNLKAGISDFIMFPDDIAKPEAGGKDPRTKSPYSSDMLELMGNSFGSIPDPSDATLATSIKPFNFPIAPTQDLVVKDKGGLVSSRYATATENIAPAVIKPESQESAAIIANEIKRGNTMEKPASKSPIREVESTNRPRVLKPTAKQFTPSVGRDLVKLVRNPPSPMGISFSPPVQPIMATVFVEDPQWPGILREVTGLLKMGSTPIVSYIGAQNSPMDESLTSGALPAGMLSSERAPLTPIRQKSENIKDKQQEIQERLTKSLAQRRLSQSPGLDGF